MDRGAHSSPAPAAPLTLSPAGRSGESGARRDTLSPCGANTEKSGGPGPRRRARCPREFFVVPYPAARSRRTPAVRDYADPSGYGGTGCSGPVDVAGGSCSTGAPGSSGGADPSGPAGSPGAADCSGGMDCPGAADCSGPPWLY